MHTWATFLSQTNVGINGDIVKLGMLGNDSLAAGEDKMGRAKKFCRGVTSGDQLLRLRISPVAAGSV